MCTDLGIIEIGQSSRNPAIYKLYYDNHAYEFDAFNLTNLKWIAVN